jgi:hypothetical protein
MNKEFKNQILQGLYDIANSQIVADLKTPEDIHAILYPFIRAVIDNPEALEEASSWNHFMSILHHLETKEPTFILLPFDVSMSFALYMYIYH